MYRTCLDQYPYFKEYLTSEMRRMGYDPEDESEDVHLQAPIPAVEQDIREDTISSDSATIRVRLERLDELVSLESELIVARSAMEQRLVELLRSVEELNLAKEKLRKISQELEGGFEVEALYGFGRASGQQASAGPVLGQPAAEFTDFDPIELDRYSKLNLIIRSLNELVVESERTGGAANLSAGKQTVRPGDIELVS